MSAPVAAKPSVPAIDWRAVETAIDEYVDGYEMIGEDESGRDGSYTTNGDERALINDAIHGLLADREFMSLLRPAPPAADQAQQDAYKVDSERAKQEAR